MIWFDLIWEWLAGDGRRDNLIARAVYSTYTFFLGYLLLWRVPSCRSYIKRSDVTATSSLSADSLLLLGYEQVIWHSGQMIITRPSLYRPTGWANKKRATLLLSISLPIINRFSNFFHCHTLRIIRNNVIIIYSTIP